MKPFRNALALALISSTLLPATALAQQAPTILGKTDVHALLEAAPSMPSSPAEAARRADHYEAIYGPFNKRAAAAHAQIKEAMQARAKNMPDKATVERQAFAQVNSNPLVAGMGGMNRIQQMTPEQQKAAALQSAAQFQQQLITGRGRNSPEMQAMMARVMSDPAYRAKLSQMSESEQRAEIQRNMGQVAPQSSEEHQRVQAQVRSQNEVTEANAIRAELGQMAQRLGDIDAEFAKKDAAITAAPGNHQQIAREIGEKEAKVPVVELGEYGRDKDPEQMVRLELEQATRDRERANWELQQRTAIHLQRKTQYKEVASAYAAWLHQNIGRINTSMADPLRNTNTELNAAGFEDGLIGLSETLAKYTANATRDAAMYENNYQDRLANRSATIAGAKR